MKGLRAVGIVGMGSYLPEQVVPNADFEKIVDTTDEWIVTRTGIRERRRARPDEASSDLCLEAARRALADARLDAQALDLIIIATVTPDMAFPATACLVQAGLGAKEAWGFDLEAGCSGFIYGLAIGTQFIATGVYDYILIVGVETFSRIINWTDRSTCILFGDGAGAAVLGPVPEHYGVLSSYLRSDGRSGNLLTQPAGGSRMPASLETVAKNLHTIHMQGNELFKIAVRVMEEAAQGALKSAGLTPADISLMVPHQANARIVDATARRLAFPPEKIYMNIERYGNISSASIPIALDEAKREGKIKRGDYILLVAFGAGLTWGANVLKWY